MSQAALKEKIEVATEALRSAQESLKGLLTTRDVIPRAQKTEVSKALQSAVFQLSDALARLDELEKSMVRAKIDDAKRAVRDAAKKLDTAIEAIDVAGAADTTWIGQTVRDAFDNLREANEALAELEQTSASTRS